MKSLTNLNTFSNTQVTVVDNRDTNIDIVQVNQTTINIENSNLVFPTINAYEIYSISNPSAINVRLQLSLSSSAATVQWSNDPRFTIVQTGTTYTVIGINSDADWNLIKNPIITLPTNFTGAFTYSFSITYNTASQSNLVVSWSVNKALSFALLNSEFNLAINADQKFGAIAELTIPVTVTASIQAVSLTEVGPAILYSSLTQNINTPILFESNSTIGATWTVIIQTPVATVSNVVATGYSAYTSYDSVTGAFIINANKTLVNQILDAIRITTTSLNSNFDIIYTATNNITTDIYSIDQLVINGNLLTYNLEVPSSLTCSAINIKRTKSDAQFISGGGISVGTNPLARIGTGCAEWTSGEYSLTISDNDNKLDFGTGDFTVEGWYRFSDITSDILLFGGTAQTGSFDFRRFTNNTLRVGRTNTAFDTVTTTGMTSANVWTHIAVTRNAGFMRIFVNGVIRWSGNNTNNYFISTTAYIGRRPSEGSFIGLVDEFRISSIARYTNTFTPSEVAFVNDSFTKLLLHLDTSTNGVTPDDNLS